MATFSIMYMYYTSFAEVGFSSHTTWMVCKLNVKENCALERRRAIHLKELSSIVV